MKKKKQLKFGGFTSTEGLTNGTEVASGATNMLVDMFSKPNQYGRESGLASGLKRGASMASMGASVGGPIGAGVGAALGLGSGLIGSISARKEERELERKANANDIHASEMKGMNYLRANPDALTGNKDAQFFKYGGDLGGKASADSIVDQQGRQFWNGFVNYVDSKGHKGSKELDRRDTGLSRQLFEEYAKDSSYSYDDFIPKVQRSISDYRTKAIEQIKAGKATYNNTTYNSKSNDPEMKMFMPGLSDVDGWAGSKTTSWKFPSETFPVKDKKSDRVVKTLDNTVYSKSKFAFGGQMDPMAPGSFEVQGPSHEQGGVKLPNGAEVEGGETISGNYVFSEELGFAKQHKPIAKALGKVGAKRETPVRKNTIHALQLREQELALQQENVKQLLGL